MCFLLKNDLPKMQKLQHVQEIRCKINMLSTHTLSQLSVEKLQCPFSPTTYRNTRRY